MGSCASMSKNAVIVGPPDHVNANRNAMYPIKSYDYQRRTTALVFPTVQKDLHPPEFNWSSTDDDAVAQAPGGGGHSSADSDADLFSTLRPSEKRMQSTLPPDLTSPEDVPLVHLHKDTVPASASNRNIAEHSATVRYMESTLVPDARDSRLMRSLKDAVDEHEEDRKAVRIASRQASRPNSASRRSNPFSAPPPLNFGVQKDNSDDEYGEL